MYGITKITRKQLKQCSEKRTNFNGLKQRLQRESTVITDLATIAYEAENRRFNKWDEALDSIVTDLADLGYNHTTRVVGKEHATISTFYFTLHISAL